MKRQKGISLIETLMAIFLTILIVSFTFEVYPTVAKSLHILENHTYAASLGNSLLNDAQLAGIDNVTNSSGTKTVTGVNNGLAYSEIFNYSVNTQVVDANKKLVWVEITWHEGRLTKKVTVETILVKR